jgi:hypothetical protein
MQQPSLTLTEEKKEWNMEEIPQNGSEEYLNSSEKTVCQKAGMFFIRNIAIRAFL